MSGVKGVTLSFFKYVKQVKVTQVKEFILQIYQASKNDSSQGVTFTCLTYFPEKMITFISFNQTQRTFEGQVQGPLIPLQDTSKEFQVKKKENTLNIAPNLMEPHNIPDLKKAVFLFFGETVERWVSQM